MMVSTLTPRLWLKAGFLGFIITLLVIQIPLAHAADSTAGNEAELVAAINAINAAGAGEHTITLTADILLTAPLPPLNNPAATSIELDGADHTLDADGKGTALTIQSGSKVIIRNITITGGAGSSNPFNTSGGGIANAGTLYIYDSVITGNTAVNAAGILNFPLGASPANLTLERVEITFNTAVDYGGGLYNNSNEGEANVTIVDSHISHNETINYGGGLANHGNSGNSFVTIENSSIDNNLSQYGGGIFNNGNGGTALFILTGVSIWENVVTNSGGGVYNNGNGGNAITNMTNTTISSNQAVKFGGGIANNPNGGNAEVSLSFTTVAFNSAQTGGGLMNYIDGSAIVAASILASDFGSDACGTSGGAAISSGGYNLDDDGSCGLSGTGDISNGNHALEPLAEHPAGTTPTHSIDIDSDALDHIPDSAAGCGSLITTDQRGAPRPYPAGGLCDIGAFERGDESGEPPVCAAPYLPDTEKELNTAIACVNNAGGGSHIIKLTGAITLTAPSTAIDNSVAAEVLLDGNGFTLNGGLSGTVVTIESGTTAVIRDLTITGGMGSSGPLNNWAGGIYNRGDLTLENSTLIGNSAAHGGGVVNHGDGAEASLSIQRSTLSGNSANLSGGGIFNTSSGEGQALLNMINSTLSGNTASGGGGGLFNFAEGGLTDSDLAYVTLSGNTASNGGGGIHTMAGGGSSTVNLVATILFNGPGGSPDCAMPSGSLTSGGYNIAGDNTCNLNQASDLPGANPNLLPLALNAPGKTATHGLAGGSPAIDHIPYGQIDCGTAVTTDQRGGPRPRPASGQCDIGAFEAVSADDVYTLFLPMIADVGK